MRSVSSSSSSGDEINIFTLERQAGASQLLGRSYELLAIKVDALKGKCTELAHELKAEKGSLRYKVHLFLDEFICPLSVMALFIGGIGITGFLFSRSDGMPFSVKGIVSALSTIALGITPPALWGLFKKLNEHISVQESELYAKLEEFKARNLQIASADAVVEFYCACECFEKNPRREECAKVVHLFDLIPWEPPIYPASGVEKLTAKQAKAVCRLFLLESLSKKMDKAFGKEKAGIEDNQTFFSQLSEHSEACVRGYFEKHYESFQKHRVPLQIVFLMKGMLNQCYLPKQSLNNNYSLPLLFSELRFAKELVESDLL